MLDERGYPRSEFKAVDPRRLRVEARMARSCADLEPDPAIKGEWVTKADALEALADRLAEDRRN